MPSFDALPDIADRARRRPASQPSLRPRHDRFRVGDGRSPTSSGAPARVARAVRFPA